MKYLVRTLGLACAVSLGACDREAPAPEPTPEPAASASPKSIFRPEFQEAVEAEPEDLEPLAVRIAFPEGSQLDKAATAKLEELLESEQFKAGGAIILRGHSDAGGSDEANMRVSQNRAEAVRDWLIEHGVAEDRITVIAFGEQNPVAPNALPDGTPDEDGRAKNRRVEIMVATAATPASPEKPSLAETLATSDDETPEPQSE